MFEAVGEEYWPLYFRKISDVLSPGGRAGLQIITIRDELFAHYRRRADFIQKYVFPGGMLPSERRIIHMALAEDRYVTTSSTGEGEARQISVTPR